MTIHSVVIQKLLSTNAHLGRRVAAHHFKIYSIGSRNGMTIVDSEKTLICLRNACSFIGELVRQRARFIFVNTNTLFDEIIDQMTETIGCRNDTSWRLGGFLTNSSSPRKFRGRNKKLNLTAIQPPDCVVIFDTERKSSVIQEAAKLQIPIVGLVDSSMPLDIYKKITYPVPAKDSVQFVYLFCNLITKTFLYEQRRLNAALGASAIAKPEIREEVEQLDKIKTVGKDKIYVLPYERLEPASEDATETKQLLDKLVVLKFNGNLGSDMGFSGPKSALEVCNGLTCLDFVVNHIESINSKYGCNIPLLMMNTPSTHDGIMKVLEKHPNKNIHTFTQSQRQQENIEDMSESRTLNKSSAQEKLYPSNLLEVFLSLNSSGKLEPLISQGKEYFLLLQSENLAEVVDPKILNHLIKNSIEHCVEVMPTTSGTEETSLPPQEGRIQSKEHVKSINTMWMSMSCVERLLQRNDLGFTSSKFFDRAFAIDTPWSRYLPVERTSDLLILQSDLYTSVEGTLVRNAARANPKDPSIELGPEFGNVDDFRSLFKSIPSIIELDSLKVTGDVWFGTGITLKGKVSIAARPGMKIVIPDGMELKNRIITSQSDIGGPSSL
ncbi:UTP--glucose-1-phosphate uridylyltransferase isoform X1 [Solanum tuberosum]|uniref:UTP--glucose-1-phosphate uridylyltransferase isoform X1 n=1 Tax=Solanum tuberosum TaxID=4113 RepID=UPI0003D26B5F|nr:PREDICTED: UTP--glucose-1-phosphate uridylyltransferase isoform X1 [Solanum tuberosum]